MKKSMTKRRSIFPTSKMQNKDKMRKKRRNKNTLKLPPNADHRTLKKPNINAVKRNNPE
jgi:hypothetical protein